MVEVPWSPDLWLTPGFAKDKGRCYPGTDIIVVRLLGDFRALNFATEPLPPHIVKIYCLEHSMYHPWYLSHQYDRCRCRLWPLWAPPLSSHMAGNQVDLGGKWEGGD